MDPYKMEAANKGYGNLAAGAQASYVNQAAQAVQRETELTSLRERLNALCGRYWRANEEMCATADRISGGSPSTSAKGPAVPPARPGILGEIDKVLESMEEAASALEDRAAYFHRLG